MSASNSWPRPSLVTATAREPLTDLELITPLIKLIDAMPPAQALGVCAAFFFRAIEAQPAMLRQILKEPVVREGTRGESLITSLNRVCR